MGFDSSSSTTRQRTPTGFPPTILFGSRVTIPGVGRFVVADRGGAVWGNHLDLWVPYVGYHHIKDWYRGVYRTT